MFNSITLRSVMSAFALIAVIAVSTSAANACDGTKHSAKTVRPLCHLVQSIKHWLHGNDKSPTNEPATDDSGYIPTDDSEPLPISG